MCATCGCADGARIRHQHDDGTWHEHGHGAHQHAGAEPGGSHPGHGQQNNGQHGHGHGQTVTLEAKVLARNDALAGQNRAWLRDRGILALNLMSSPGAGKTTLLERTARDLAGELAIGVIEGDQETALDADRMRAAGCRVVLASVTEGADKPVKYPHMFRSADLVLITKTDLLPYLDFDLDRCTADLGTISPGATVLPVSARAGDGIGQWYHWLRQC